MTADEVNNLVGKSMGHCWDFTRFVQARFYGRTLPPVVVDINNRTEVINLLADDEEAMCERCGYRLVAKPKDGDIAVMARRTDDAAHVGVYLENDGGGILHTEITKPVAFTALKWMFQCGYQTIRYYRPLSD